MFRHDPTDVPMVRLEPEPSSYANDSASESVSASERVGLDDLCDDILVEIIRRAGTRDHGSSISGITKCSRVLFNLAMCSRRLHRLTEPILYNDLTEATDFLRCCPNLLWIFRRLLARPDLARCVKRFTGSALGNDFGGELTDEDRMRLRTAVHEASTSDDEAARWIQDAESGDWAAIVSLLFTMTPNLEELTVEDWSFDNEDYTYLFAFLDRAKKLQDSGEESPFSMSKLRSVTVTYYDTESGPSLHQMMPFLDLRSVETFRAHMLHENIGFGDDIGSGEDLEDPLLKDPHSTLSTKDLTLTGSFMSDYAMVLILRCFPQLERFHYDAPDFQPRLLAALEHLKPCLKELTLLFTKDGWLSGLGPIYPIGSLADFQKLVSITANSSIMTGVDSNGEENAHDDNRFAATHNLVSVVPPTLEFLCLKDCKRDVVGHIFELVSQKTSRIPALRKIVLCWTGIKYSYSQSSREPILHYPDFNEDEVENLMADCKAAGIEISIEALPPEPKCISFEERREPVDEKSAALGLPPIPKLFRDSLRPFFPELDEQYEEEY